MLWTYRQPCAARQYWMSGDQSPAMADQPVAAGTHDLDGLADQTERYRVAVAVDRHQPVVGDDPRADHGLQEAGLAGRGHQCGHFVGKAVDRSLVGRAVIRRSAISTLPERQLPIEVVEVGEAAAGDEVAFDVFHAGLDLALVWAR